MKYEAATPLGQALEDYRVKHKMGRSGLAKTLGVANSRISEFIHGKRKPNLKIVKRMYALGFPADLLLKDDK